MWDYDFFEISRSLERHHSIFNALWEIGEPVLTNRIPTACIKFDRYGKGISFEFNPNFWDSLDIYNKTFVLCHEMLHIILNHGVRMKNAPNKMVANVALDLVVNHSLVNNFGFSRSRIANSDKICWVDTVFPDQNVPDNETFEFYYKLIKPPDSEENSSSGQDGSPGDGNGPPQLVDDHTGFDGQDTTEVAEEAAESLSNGEKDDLKDAVGKEAGNLMKVLEKKKIIRKKKWETVIKKWSKKYEEYEEKEQWVRPNRRGSLLKSDLLLPSVSETDHATKSRVDVWFFQDTSGSCQHLADRFFNAAQSLDPRRFDVKMHCFDTKVYKTDLKSRKLYGFGGTSFTCIEQYIQSEVAKGARMASAVFVLTDGYGDNINPVNPKRWHWFLSENYIQCISKDCNIHMLSDFE